MMITVRQAAYENQIRNEVNNMKAAIQSLTGTKKRKAIALSLCAVLILSLGTMTAFAADSEILDRFLGRSSYAIRVGDDGSVLFSSDGGSTWDGSVPGNVDVQTDENGEVTSVTVNVTGDGDGGFVSTWAVDGDSFFDGGQRGSIFENILGEELDMDQIRSRFEGRDDVESFAMMFEPEDGGTAFYSYNGSDWSETVPEGFDVDFDISADGGSVRVTQTIDESMLVSP